MYRVLTVLLAALALAPSAFAGGPNPAGFQGGVGALTPGHPIRYVARARPGSLLLENGRRVVAIELLAAAEAIDLVGRETLAAGTRAAYDAIRRLVPPLLEDRPLGRDVERLADTLGAFAS